MTHAHDNHFWDASEVLPSVRARIAKEAQTHGIKQTANRYHVNALTVSKWKNYFCGVHPELMTSFLKGDYDSTSRFHKVMRVATGAGNEYKAVLHAAVYCKINGMQPFQYHELISSACSVEEIKLAMDRLKGVSYEDLQRLLDTPTDVHILPYKTVGANLKKLAQALDNYAFAAKPEPLSPHALQQLGHYLGRLNHAYRRILDDDVSIPSEPSHSHDYSQRKTRRTRGGKNH